MYGFADIEYTECDLTAYNRAAALGRIRYPSRRVARTLPFLILSENKDDINVKLLEPRQLNYGYGPSSPQRYYKIDRGAGTLGVYYETYKTGDFKVALERGSAKACFRDRGAGIDLADKHSECCVCMGDYEVAAIMFPCEHVQCCAACALKLADNKCPVCRADISDAVECVRVARKM